jgi:hypothetical protein
MVLNGKIDIIRLLYLTPLYIHYAHNIFTICYKIDDLFIVQMNFTLYEMIQESWTESLDNFDDNHSNWSKVYRRMVKAFVATQKLLNNIHEIRMAMYDLDDCTDEYKTKRRLHDKLCLLLISAEKKLDRLKFELEILDANSDYYIKLIHYYDNKSTIMDQTHIITPTNHAVKRISRTKRRQLENELCSICLDTHSYRDIVRTSCGHIFGKCCFQNHLKALNKRNSGGDELMTCCPMCRSTKLSMTLFAIK